MFCRNNICSVLPHSACLVLWQLVIVLQWRVKHIIARISSTACEDIVNGLRGYRQRPARISSHFGVAVIAPILLLRPQSV